VINDSGPAHCATLTPVWTVVLFGPETPRLFAARTPRNRAPWVRQAGEESRIFDSTSVGMDADTSHPLAARRIGSRCILGLDVVPQPDQGLAREVPHPLLLVLALEVEGSYVGPGRERALAQQDRVRPLRDRVVDRMLGVEQVAALLDVAEPHRLAHAQRPAVRPLLAHDHPEAQGAAPGRRASTDQRSRVRQARISPAIAFTIQMPPKTRKPISAPSRRKISHSGQSGWPLKFQTARRKASSQTKA